MLNRQNRKDREALRLADVSDTAKRIKGRLNDSASCVSGSDRRIACERLAAGARHLRRLGDGVHVLHVEPAGQFRVAARAQHERDIGIAGRLLRRHVGRRAGDAPRGANCSAESFPGIERRL